MIQLDRVTLREIRLRLKEPFRISSGVVEERRILLLELHDADGAREWAECVAGEWPNYSSETIDTAWFAIREWLAPRVLGKAIGAPEAAHEILERNVSATHGQSALEMGCYGIASRKREIALAAFMGDSAIGSPPASRSGFSAIHRLVERAARAIADGYRKIKVKIQPGADIEYVRAVRTALPRGTDLMADATRHTRSRTPTISPHSTSSASS